MPEPMAQRLPDHVEADGRHSAADRILDTRAGLTTLLKEAEEARRRRAEAAAGSDAASAVCAWNHFENIPTFYNWNNRPR
jgi:hypothetical protein